MSLLRFVSRGENNCLTLITAEDYTLHLFATDVETGLTETQLDALDETDLTESTFTGYAAIPLAGGGATWSVVSSDPSRATAPQQTFTCSGGSPQDVWGYYLTADFDSDSLVAFEQFDGPVTISNGDSLRVTPRINLEDGDNVTPTGMITAFGGASAPTGWQMCDGSAISRSSNAALFAAIGTTYGPGNGTTTFNVPDLRQRFPLGKAASGTGVTLGSTGGAIDHVHGLDSSSSAALIRGSDATGTLRSRLKTVPSWTPTDSRNLGTSIANASITQATELTGDSDTENPPFQVVNFIIKL